MDKVLMVKVLTEFLDFTFSFNDKIKISVKQLLIVAIILVITGLILRYIRKWYTRKMDENDVLKFKSLFSYTKWLIYVFIFITSLSAIGVNVTAVLTASAALLIGVGLALQTLFQDIIAGVLILIDKTIRVSDIIEINGKVGRIIEVRLRTTRAVTIDNKVLVIPNHLYLCNTLFNWTQNGKTTRDSVSVGVAYGSDVQKVKSILLQAANAHKAVCKHPEPVVFFEDFGDSALQFKLVFTLSDSFQGVVPRSDLRFEIERLFREHQISIPFPQRDLHIINPKDI